MSTLQCQTCTYNRFVIILQLPSSFLCDCLCICFCTCLCNCLCIMKSSLSSSLSLLKVCTGLLAKPRGYPSPQIRIWRPRTLGPMHHLLNTSSYSSLQYLPIYLHYLPISLQYLPIFLRYLPIYSNIYAVSLHRLLNTSSYLSSQYLPFSKPILVCFGVDLYPHLFWFISLLPHFTQLPTKVWGTNGVLLHFVYLSSHLYW